MATSSNYYNLYIADVLTLANTIIIKSQETIDGLNKLVNESAQFNGTEYVNTVAPETWKYYMNISGQYHHLDDMMKVVSLDTLEEINFTKENLLTHLATKAGYSYGTRQYKELLLRYPNQELLIKGILYPVDIDKAINSPDGTILSYPDGLVEFNEYSLIRKLQTWVYGFKERWVNAQYHTSDSLYAATSLGIMYLNLVPAILSIRLAACKTNEAHSFHVKQYLASHGFLNQYLDNMTLRQALFFYRNISYIERNSGKKEIFEWLVEHIMTERSLPLAEFYMKHDLSEQPENIYPALVFKNNSLNGNMSANTKSDYTLEEILNKEVNQARDNVIYNPIYQPIIKERMENSLSNTALTKLLESAVIDYSNSALYSIEEILLNHWLYLSSLGLYKSYVTVINPKTNEKIALTTKDAFTVYWYAYCRSINIDVVKVPKLIATRVQRIPMVTPEDALSVVDKTLVNSSVFNTAISIQPVIKPIISTQAFYSCCEKIYQSTLLQIKLISNHEDYRTRGMVANMVNRIYCDKYCSLGQTDEAYETWFKDRLLDISDLSQTEFGVLATNTLEAATSLKLNQGSSLKNLQKAMIGLLSQLSSYSIQVVSDINDSAMKVTQWPAVRPGNILSDSKTNIKYTDYQSRVIKFMSHLKEKNVVDFGNNNTMGSISMSTSDSIDIDIGVDINLGNKGIVYMQILNLDGVRVKPQYPLSKNDQDVIPVFGTDTYLNLNSEQQQTLKDIYNVYVALPPADNSGEIIDAIAQTLYQKQRYVTPNYNDKNW